MLLYSLPILVEALKVSIQFKQRVNELIIKYYYQMRLKL